MAGRLQITIICVNKSKTKCLLTRGTGAGRENDWWLPYLVVRDEYASVIDSAESFLKELEPHATIKGIVSMTVRYSNFKSIKLIANVPDEFATVNPEKQQQLTSEKSLDDSETSLATPSNSSAASFSSVFVSPTQNLPLSELIKWVNLSELEDIAMNKTRKYQLIGPEPIRYLKYLKKGGPAIPVPMLHDIEEERSSLGDALHSSQVELLKSAKFSAYEQEKLWRSFLKFSFPSSVLNESAFANYMSTEGGVDQEKSAHYFRAFDADCKHFLAYKDFLVGLAAVQPHTVHGGPSAEERCKHIFRYYDKNGDGSLDFEELIWLITDKRRLKGEDLEEDAVKEETLNCAQIFEVAPRGKVSQVKFLTAVGKLKLRGTSGLLRLPFSTFMQDSKTRGRKLNAPKDTHSLHFTFDAVTGSSGVGTLEGTSAEALAASEGALGDDPESLAATSNNSLESLQTEFTDHGQLLSTAPQLDYELATHSVKVKRTGTVTDITSLWDFKGTSTITLLSEQSIMDCEAQRVNRLPSIDAFDQKTNTNEMLAGLQYFERPLRDGPFEKAAFSWGSIDKAAFARCFITLCTQARVLIAREPRLLRINKPTYILGDIHGNFADLINFEKVLWRLGPILTPANFLFLGDYVDRGEHGVEVVAYLLAQKLLAPQKFFLIRGNHEVRMVQRMFTFERECESKFGHLIGHEVWEAANSVFDVMPISAVVDNKVFCTHGGIPRPLHGGGYLKAIERIPCPLTDPEVQSQLSWELMWSDPIHTELTPDEELLVELESNHGFAANRMRATAFVFTAPALNEFLSRNRLSHVVRAHEVVQAGFQVHAKGKLLTVFSSSKYCGGSNEAACVLVDRGKLRSIRIDTSS